MLALKIALVVLILAAGALLGVVLWGLIATRRIVAQSNQLVQPLGHFVQINNSRIHYYEIGEGRPILFIHGLGGHYHHMRRPLMEAFGPGYRLIAIDREGSGHSTRATGSSGRLTEQANMITAFIDKLELDRPLLVGHSLGGAIALATALDFPGKISGLALLSPLTQPVDTLRPEFRALYIGSPWLRRFIAHTFAVPLSVRNADATIDFVFGPQTAPDDFAVEGGAMLGLRPSHFYAASTDLVAIPRDLANQQRRYGELQMPVGILYGSADKVLEHEIHGLRMREQIPGLEFELLHGIGHMPQYAETKKVVAFIKRLAEKAEMVRATGIEPVRS